MNERTIQLYKQAVDFAYTTAGKDAGKGTVVEGLTAGKFAELIVQECIDIIAPYTVRMSRPGEEYLHPILEIRKHFGVEE